MLAAAAGATPPLFDAMYWLKGALTVIPAPAADNHPVQKTLDQRRVVFYKVLPGGFVESVPFNVSGDNGKYTLNIYDEASLTIDPNVTYYVAVANDPVDNYGATPEAVNISGNGFDVKNLDIVYGAGPIIPLDGAIQLFISRFDSDNNGSEDSIKISWDPAQEAGLGTPQFFCLLNIDSNENGTGIYVNQAGGWTKIEDFSMGNYDLTKAASDHYILHKNQVGQGYKEYYYKAMRFGYATTAVDSQGKNILETAWAVGKINIPISGDNKFSLLSAPFIDTPADINSLFGTQADYSAGNEPSTSVLLFSFENGGFNRGSYFNGSTWLVIPGLQAAVNNSEKGLYLKTKSGDPNKTFTLVGSIKLLSDSTSYSINNNWNLMSLPYARQMSINSLVLTVGAKNDNKDNADLVFGFANGGFNKGSYLNASGTWAPIPGLAGVELINVASPIYYYSLTQGTLNWTVKPSSAGYQ